MKHKSLILLAAVNLLLVASSFAQANLHLHLQDGSILNGYISSQTPGKSIVFVSNSAEIVLDNQPNGPAPQWQFLPKKVKAIIDRKVLKTDVVEPWRTWADTHDAYIGRGDTAYLLLNDIVLSDMETLCSVKILQRGVSIRYLDFTANTYDIPFGRVTRITADARPAMQLTGIDRRYKLRSGTEYQGQYVGEVPGRTLSLLQSNGVVQIFNRADVAKDLRCKVNDNQTLLEQSDLIDVVQLTSGTTLRGVIFERNYSASDSITNDYLLIQLESGVTQSIALADVAEYRKEKNPRYTPLSDVKLSPGSYMVNRIPVMPLRVTEIDNTLCIDADSVYVTLGLQRPSTTVRIETAVGDGMAAPRYNLVEVSKFDVKKGKKSVYGFSYQKVVSASIEPVKTYTTIHGTLCMTFELSHAGTYVLYNSDTQQVLAFHVQ